MSTVSSEGTLRLFPAAFYIFWHASPRSFGSWDEGAAEPKLLLKREVSMKKKKSFAIL